MRTIKVPKVYFGTDHPGRTAVPTLAGQPSSTALDMLPDADMVPAGGFIYEIPTADSLSYLLQHPLVSVQRGHRGVQ